MADYQTQPFYQIVKGYKFPNTLYSSKETIEQVLDYIPHDGDVIVASYPKTGSTWLRYIVLQITSNGKCFPSFDDTLYKVFPLMELVGIEAVDDLKPPRTYSHHCPYDMVEKNPNAKCLYIYRRPEDTLISYFHFLKDVRGDKHLVFDQFFARFLAGDIGHGRYFEHVLSYYKNKADENLLMVSYEKLHENRVQEILRIARFLGKEYYDNITKDESVLEAIVENTRFEYMKKHLPFSRPKHFAQDVSSNEDERFEFFRKGIIGDGKKSLSCSQLNRLQGVMKEVMNGTEIIVEWLKY